MATNNNNNNNSNNNRSVLHKKLQEMEAELHDIFHLSLDTTSTSLPVQPNFDDLKHRFVFLRKLLRREIESSHPRNSEELHCIGRRLTALESAFRDWNEWRLAVCADCTRALIEDSPVPENDVVRENTPQEESCTEVVTYDDVWETVSEFSGDDESAERPFFDSVEKEEGEEGRGWRRMGRRYGRVFGCGVIFGAILVVKLFAAFYSYSSVDYFVEYEALLVHPT